MYATFGFGFCGRSWGCGFPFYRSTGSPATPSAPSLCGIPPSPSPRARSSCAPRIGISISSTPTTATRTSPRYSATHFRMDKTTFIRTLTEERCDDFRLRLDMKTEGELKVTWIAPLMRTTWICWWSSRVPPRMLSGHRPSPRGAQAHRGGTEGLLGLR